MEELDNMSLINLVDFSNINERNQLGETLLLIACNTNNRKMAEQLLQLNADPNIGNFYGETPLHAAARISNFYLVCDLLGFKAEVDAFDDFGRSPLYYSTVCHANIAITDYMIRKGRFHAVNHFDLLLENVAHCNSHERIVVISLLLNYGININITDPITNRNCLHIVAATNYQPLAEFLLENGAILNIEDNFGYTPLDIAKLHQNYKIYELFLNWRRFQLGL